MPRRFVSPLALCVLALTQPGCTPAPQVTREEDFSPSRLRLHQAFTQVKDWTGDGKTDGVEVVVELLDSYGEPARGRGTLVFELWSYRKYSPDVLGTRVVEPWRATLLTRDEQDARWSKALRSYTFQLASDRVNPAKEYVLTASFETAGGADAAGGARLYDRLILEPPPEKREAGEGVRRAGGKRGGGSR